MRLTAVFISLLCFIAICPLPVFGDSEVQVEGTLNIAGAPGTDGIIFPDSTKQITAATTSLYQQLVSGTCPAGQAINQIYSSGGVNCQTVGTGTVTGVGTGTGLTGGLITTSGTISLANTSVTPGVYMRANITVDQQGRITSAGSGGAVDLGSDVTGTLSTIQGGTGATSPAAALTNLGGVSKSGDTMSGNLSVPSVTMTGNLNLPATTASTSGVLTLGGIPFIHTYGNGNTFVGSGAGNFGMTGPGGNVGVGQSALVSDTTGSNNVAVGFHSLLNNTTGSTNIAVGGAALLNNISGSGNTAYGGSALVFNILGNGNTAIGDNALYNNKADSNTALGYNAGYNQTTGSNNIYIGYYVQGVDGENNTIRIGNGTTQAYIAGTVNATGFAGNGSGLTNVTASAVTGAVPVANGGTGATTAAGALADLGAVSLTGSYADPTWITSLAGSKINGNISTNSANVTGIVAIANGGTGAANVSAARTNLGVPGLATTNSFSVGPQTFATGAAGNIALLVQGAPSQTANLQEWRNSGGTVLASVDSAGDLTTSGNINLPATTATSGMIKFGGNIFIHSYGSSNFFAGLAAGNQTVTGDTNTASGANALNGNTGGSLNTATGGNALKVNTTGSFNTATGASALISNIGGTRNTATGTYSLQNNIGGSYNTAIAYGSLSANTGGSYNTAVGYEAGQTITTGTYNTFIGYSADASANYFTNATAIGNGAIVDASNKVRIGNSLVAVIEGAVNMTTPSDSRLKKDVEDIGQGLAFIRSLRPVQYRFTNGNDRIDFGFIAQDIEVLLGTDYNVLGIGRDTERTLSLRYTDFIAPLVKAVQEQQFIINSQKDKIKTLEDRLSRLEALVGTR